MADVVEVAVTVYTDPWCPFSWATEPQRRRIEVEFGNSIAITYVMGGMQHVLSKPAEFAERWLEASERSGMPADPRSLLASPPDSTHPAGIAVKAVADQAHPGAFLRRLREAIFLERRRMDRAEHFMDLAREVQPSLNQDRLRIDLASHGVLEAFGSDLDRASGVELPTLEVAGERVAEPDRWHDALLGAGAEPCGEWPLHVEDCVRRFAPVAAAEVAQLCDLPGPRAAAELWRLALEWRVRPRRVLFGEVWEPA